MRLRFTKMQGVGNDFVVVDAIGQNVLLDAARVRQIADRHFGVGCDQLLLIERPRSPGTDFYYRIFNADGEEVQHCGNGARCFLRYVRDKHLTDKREIRVETMAGVITPRLETDGQVTVDMGPPIFAPGKIPFIAEREQLTYQLDVDGKTIEVETEIGVQVIRAGHIVIATGSNSVELPELRQRGARDGAGPLHHQHGQVVQRAPGTVANPEGEGQVALPAAGTGAVDERPGRHRLEGEPRGYRRQRVGRARRVDGDDVRRHRVGNGNSLPTGRCEVIYASARHSSFLR